jgi:hypothetical protein
MPPASSTKIEIGEMCSTLQIPQKAMLRTSGREAAKKASQAISHLAAGNKSRDSDDENVDADASNAHSTPGKSPKTKRVEEPARNVKRSKPREPEAFSDKEGDSFDEATKSPGRAVQSKRESLFSKISTSASAIASVSKQLVKVFQSNPDKGIADILCLVVEAAGLPSSKISIKAKDIQTSEPSDFCDDLCRNIKDGEFTTQFSSRPKNVKSNFRNFWLKFMREAEPMLTENEGLIFQLHEWLSTLSSSKLLSLRMAATEASLLVVTGLAKAAGAVASSGSSALVLLCFWPSTHIHYDRKSRRREVESAGTFYVRVYLRRFCPSISRH